LFKQYQELLGKEDILVIRHDAFQSLSVEGGNPDDEAAVKAVAGFDEGDPSPRTPDETEKEKIKELRKEAHDNRKAKIDGRSEEEKQAYEEYYTGVEEKLAATPMMKTQTGCFAALESYPPLNTLTWLFCKIGLVM